MSRLAYIYQAALLCEQCAKAVKAGIKAGTPSKVPVNYNDESSFDSDDYPKGPYTDGGGESDSPAHCDQCNVFLENPLTTDGVRYVLEAIAERPNSEVVQEWAEFYQLPVE